MNRPYRSSSRTFRTAPVSSGLEVSKNPLLSEIDAENVRMKVHVYTYSTIHLQECAFDYLGNRVRIAFRMCEHYMVGQKAEPQTHDRNSVKL